PDAAGVGSGDVLVLERQPDVVRCQRGGCRGRARYSSSACCVRWPKSPVSRPLCMSEVSHHESARPSRGGAGSGRNTRQCPRRSCRIRIRRTCGRDRRLVAWDVTLCYVLPGGGSQVRKESEGSATNPLPSTITSFR